MANSTTATEVENATSAFSFREDEAREQLAALLAPLPVNTQVEIRRKRGDDVRSIFGSIPAVLARLHDLTSDERCWFGIVRRKAGTRNGAGDGIAWASAVWADFDGVDADALVERLCGGGSGGPAPTMIVNSGGGAHAYWRLDRDVDVRNPEQATRLREICYGVARTWAPTKPSMTCRAF